MIPRYKYIIWNGKTQIGDFYSSVELTGDFLYIPMFSVLKEPYAPSKKRKDIKLPLQWLNTENSNRRKVFELVIVVKGKSKKQKDAIIKAGASFYAPGETP